MIKRCKVCNAILTYDIEDLDKVSKKEIENRRPSTTLSARMGFCKECFKSTGSYKW